jgi:hypothetical protein
MLIAALEITHRPGATRIDPICIAACVAGFMRMRKGDYACLVKTRVLSPTADVYWM